MQLTLNKLPVKFFAIWILILWKRLLFIEQTWKRIHLTFLNWKYHNLSVHSSDQVLVPSLPTLKSPVVTRMYSGSNPKGPANPRHSVWKPRKKIKKLPMVGMLIFCTIMIYFNDLRFKKQNFPKICWDILWFIKGHPLKCKKS